MFVSHFEARLFDRRVGLIHNNQVSLLSSTVQAMPTAVVNSSQPFSLVFMLPLVCGRGGDSTRVRAKEGARARSQEVAVLELEPRTCPFRHSLLAFSPEGKNTSGLFNARKFMVRLLAAATDGTPLPAPPPSPVLSTLI